MRATVTGLDGTISLLYNRIKALLDQYEDQPRKRLLIALAGCPGSGKSTVCEAVVKGLQEYNINDVAVLPMDGFHYPKARLHHFEDPYHAFRRRGAPFTYDADAFVKFVVKLKDEVVTNADEAGSVMLAPSFDHAIQDPVANDISISSKARIVIIEGNYVLFDERPWNTIASLAHERWFVDTPLNVAKQRLINRHLHAGIEENERAASDRAEENDIPNGKLIRDKLIMPDVTISN